MQSTSTSTSTWPRRRCPFCDHSERTELVAPTATAFCGQNSTYLSEFATLLGLDSDAKYPIADCDACGFTYAAYEPPPQFLDTLYDRVINQERAIFESESPARIAVQCKIAQAVCNDLYANNSAQPVYKVLDFGCGYGTLLKILDGWRIKATGFDNSAARCERLIERGLNAVVSVDDLRSKGPFDAITLVDVLEHVTAPLEVLSLCKSLLTRSGFICVSVPDFPRQRLRSIRAQVQSGQPFARDLNPWEHLNYFDGHSLSVMMQKAGFVCREPLGGVEIGIRPRLTGVRRFGNVAKSVGRALRYAAAGSAPGTLQIGFLPD